MSDTELKQARAKVWRAFDRYAGAVADQMGADPLRLAMKEANDALDHYEAVAAPSPTVSAEAAWGLFGTSKVDGKEYCLVALHQCDALVPLLENFRAQYGATVRIAPLYLGAVPSPRPAPTREELVAAETAREATREFRNGLQPLKLGAWRRVMAIRHGCTLAALYGDDGELQCKACGVDFARMEPEEIEAAWMERGLRAFAKSAPAEAAEREESADIQREAVRYRRILAAHAPALPAREALAKIITIGCAKHQSAYELADAILAAYFPAAEASDPTQQEAK